VKSFFLFLFLGAKTKGFFRKDGSRYPLQSCKPNPGLQGFSLLSGLKSRQGFFFGNKEQHQFTIASVFNR
jgi:hypothetical protein